MKHQQFLHHIMIVGLFAYALLFVWFAGWVAPAIWRNGRGRRPVEISLGYRIDEFEWDESTSPPTMRVKKLTFDGESQ